MIATLLVRPRVTVFLSARRSISSHSGLYAFTLAEPAAGFL